jgi:hypothetical protein
MKWTVFAAVLLVVVIVIAGLGALGYYFATNPASAVRTNTIVSTATIVSLTSNGPTSSNQPSTSVQPPQTQLIQESTTIASVDSGGGHFVLTSLQSGYSFGDQGPVVLSVSSGQASSIQYGEDLEIRLTYVPLQRTLFDTFGKVTSLSTTQVTITALNNTIPSAVPSGWHPELGGSVVLSVSPETGTPLVTITALQVGGDTCSAWTSSTCISSSSASQFAAGIVNSTCAGLANGAFLGGACTLAATGQPLSLGLTLTNYPPCYSPSYRTCALSVVAAGSGFSVTSVQPNQSGYIGIGITVILTVPRTDFVGALQLTFIFTPS